MGQAEAWGLGTAWAVGQKDIAPRVSRQSRYARGPPELAGSMRRGRVGGPPSREGPPGSF